MQEILTVAKRLPGLFHRGVVGFISLPFSYPFYLHFLMVRPDLLREMPRNNYTGLSVHLLQSFCMHAILCKLGDNFFKRPISMNR